MKTLYLVRHGESEQNAGNPSVMGLPDHAVQLTGKGMLQARSAGRFLRDELTGLCVDKNDVALYASPFVRTRETRDEMLKSIPWVQSRHENPMLVELSFGMFNNVPKDELPERFPLEYAIYRNDRKENGKYFAKRPNGESPLDCEIRQRIFLNEILYGQAPDEHGHIIIVGHGAQLTVLLKALTGRSHEWYEGEPAPKNASIRRIRIYGRTVMDDGYIFEP